MVQEMRGSDGLKVVINGIRLGLLPSLVCRASLRGMSAARHVYLFSDKVAAVTSFEEVCSKLSSSSVERFVSRTNTS